MSHIQAFITLIRDLFPFSHDGSILLVQCDKMKNEEAGYDYAVCVFEELPLHIGQRVIVLKRDHKPNKIFPVSILPEGADDSVGADVTYIFLNPPAMGGQTD